MKIVVLMAALLLTSSGHRTKPTADALFGRIQFVDAHPDVRVQVVTHRPDLDVKLVREFADGPGKWKIVHNFPDFRVKIVHSHPDLRVRFVDPGPR